MKRGDRIAIRKRGDDCWRNTRPTSLILSIKSPFRKRNERRSNECEGTHHPHVNEYVINVNIFANFLQNFLFPYTDSRILTNVHAYEKNIAKEHPWNFPSIRSSGSKKINK